MALTYAPGSLAAQPVRQIPSSKRRGTAASDAPMRQAIHDANRAPMGLTPPTQQTRQDRIIAARMDGTFNTKRDTFNQANAGKLAMDEAGNITPITAAPAAAAPSPPTAPAPVNPVPPVNTVTPPTPKLPAGGSPPMMKPVGKIDGRPASLVLQGMKSGSPSPRLPVSPSPGLRPPVTRTASGELVQPGTPMDPNARWQKPGAPVTPSVTPPVTRNATVTPPVTPLSPQQEKQFTALGQAHQLSQATQGPMPRVSTTSAMPAKFVAPAGGFSPEFHRQFDPVASAPPPAVAPATALTVKPPPPKTLAELKAAAEAAKAARQPGLVKVGTAIQTGATQAGQAIASGASALTQGGAQLAQTINTGVPQLAKDFTGAIDAAGKKAVSSIDSAVAPARNWLAGSDQKSPEELAYEAALAEEQKKTAKKPTGVPAVLPNPKSTSPQPFSAATLGTSKPRAVIPPPLAMLNK